MIRKPRGKLTRRDGSLDLFSGHRSEESKCKKDKPPGQHGANQGRQTGYCKQLRAKQMVKRMCGIGEKQFRNAFNKAARKKGSTGENLIQFVECRLDNVVYRMGFACTRAEARQLVSHRSILVNGKIVNIPSYQVAVGDVVSVREKSKGQLRIQAALALAQGRSHEWVEVDSAHLSGTFKRIPDRDQVFQNVNEQLIVELYSK